MNLLDKLIQSRNYRREIELQERIIAAHEQTIKAQREVDKHRLDYIESLRSQLHATEHQNADLQQKLLLRNVARRRDVEIRTHAE